MYHHNENLLKMDVFNSLYTKSRPRYNYDPINPGFGLVHAQTCTVLACFCLFVCLFCFDWVFYLILLHTNVDTPQILRLRG